MKEIGNAIGALGLSLVFATGIHGYFSPYNQCVRGKTTLNENNEMVRYPYPKSSAQVECAKIFGGSSD